MVMPERKHSNNPSETEFLIPKRHRLVRKATPQDGLNPANAKLLGKNFFRSAELLDIPTSAQLIILGLNVPKTYYNWKNKLEIGQNWDTFKRASHFIAIHSMLNTIYNNPEISKKWFNEKRNIFKGKSALELIVEDPMNSQAALYSIRHILNLYLSGSILELN